MSKSFNEKHGTKHRDTYREAWDTKLNKILHYMIQVTGIILFKAYIIYGSYGSNHVFCKQIQTGLKWLYSAQKYKATLSTL